MMSNGFVPIAAVSPAIKVADPAHNGLVSYEAIKGAYEKGARVVVLPECTMTSYISNDFLYQDTLLEAAENELEELVAKTMHMDVVFIIGIPLRINCTLYNSAAVCHKGRILGIVPKTHIPTYGVDFEGRWFESGPAEISMISIAGQDDVPFGSHQVFRNRLLPELCIGVEICEDIWSPNPPSIQLALAGATVLCNCSASNASIEKAIYRRGLISGQSARLLGSYIYCSSGNGDSTEDVLVGGHDLVTENGHILAEAKPFGGGFAMSEVDVEGLCAARRGMSSFVVAPSPGAAGYREVTFDMKIPERPLTREVSNLPFVPSASECEERCELVTAIQEHGLLIKMGHASAKHVTMKLSDEPDDVLALLLCAKAFDMGGIPRSNIYVACSNAGDGGASVDDAGNMPNATAGNAPGSATRLAKLLGCTMHECSCTPHELARHAKAKAEELHGIVLGSYDMTRLSVGAAIFPCDMELDYAINSCVARTLVPLLIHYLANSFNDRQILAAAMDASSIPAELYACASGDARNSGSDGASQPSTHGIHIAHKPHESDAPLHIPDAIAPVDVVDFYLSCLLGSKDCPAKTLRLAKKAFENQYSGVQLLDWLREFYKRFFGTQYDRRNLPDGPEVGSVNISPRGGFMMPARDAGALWIEQAAHLRA